MGASKVLVTVMVAGSTGPLRFLVGVNDSVSALVDMTLKAYERQGRLPHLSKQYVDIYCNDGEFAALKGNERVGDLGTREFLMYKKKEQQREDVKVKNRSNNWLNKIGFASLVYSH